VAAGVEQGAAVTGRWADELVEALGGRETESGIRAAIAAAGERFDVDTLADHLEEQLLRSTMLGVLDVDWEVEHEDEVDLVTFAGKFPDVADIPLAHQPFTEAIDAFRRRNVMPRPAFDLLSREAKRKAFTVARLARQDLLDTAHAELLRQLERSGKPTRKDPATGKWIYEGPNYREFQRFARERLESAGWTPANASHVETIYRTNIVGAYATGRHAQMTSPAVVARMPYWQIRGVQDDRQRDTHKRAHGIILRADHPFWKKAFPPFGFNCRCRVIARSQAWVDRMGATIGPVPQGLPDPGFDSGTSRMPAIPAALQAQPPPQPNRPPAPSPAQQSGPTRPPGAIPVSIPRLPPTPPPPVPIAPPPPLPKRPVDRRTFERLGVDFTGATEKIRDERHAEVQATAQRLFGRTLDPQEVLRIAGTRHLQATATVTAEAFANELSVRAVYKNTDGTVIGRIARDFHRGTGGQPEVYHAFFKLADELQGKGTARAVLRDAFQEYARLGVKRVTVTAAWKGRYTWARMGFRHAGTKAEFTALVGRFGAWLEEQGIAKKAAKAMTTKIRTMHDLARTQVGELEAGKRFLTGLPDDEMFRMEMNLDPSDPGYRIAVEYLGL
jgi:SPP1 gp7 family putative phage head morphogenesis protein